MTTAFDSQLIWDHEVLSNEPRRESWLWDGFLAEANVTLLTGLWKAGKTTLLTLLLARRHLGGTLAGLGVRPGKTLVVTEESTAKWAERARRHDFGGQVCFLPRPFRAIPTPDQWQALLDKTLELRARHGIDLLVLDPLAPLLRNETCARAVLETLLPLDCLTAAGMAVLATHHPRKGQAALGEAARGSGALLGHVDISIEMRRPGGAPASRVRRLCALSRFDQTPPHLLVELSPDGADYRVVDEVPADGFESGWPILRKIFEEAPQKLTRIDVLYLWPDDFDKPSATILRAWLDRATGANQISREGQGRKSDPFRYWLPEREAVWKENPMYEIHRDLEARYGFVSLAEKKRGRREKGEGGD